MKKLLSASLISFSLNAYAYENKDIEGIWAMLPLQNGIANVAQFDANGTATLYPFNCANPEEKLPPETSTYSIDRKSNTIQLTSAEGKSSLEIAEVTDKSMVLNQKINNDVSLQFVYAKAPAIIPLCMFYTSPKPKTGYQPTDFVASPTIPAHPQLSRFEGKWVNTKASEEIEVVKDSDGNYFLKTDSSENWNFLYNTVHWSGDELRFRKYSYSDKESLFDHSFHKFRVNTSLSLTSDTTMKQSYFTPLKQLDLELTKQ